MEPTKELGESFEIKQSISKMICSSCGQEYSLDKGIKNCPLDGALLAPILNDPFIGKILNGKYEILSLLGSGGYAQVYLANHLDLDRKVAIKILSMHLVSDLDSIKRFENEAKAIALIRHGSIVALHDYGLLPQPYLVMEFVEGENLERAMKGTRYSPAEAVSLLTQVCDGMDVAHKAGIVHRDLKPSNIMLQEHADGQKRAKILDFGVAKLTSDAMQSISRLTQSGETMGSPPYMSPEQCLGRELDGRSDIYSLGCLLFEMLSGEKPYGAGNPVELMHKHMMSPVPDLNERHPEINAPASFAYIIKRAMAKEVDARYQSTVELKDDLIAARDLSPKQFQERVRLRSKGPLVAFKHTRLLFSAVAAVLLIGSPLVFFFFQSHSSSPKILPRVATDDPVLLEKIERARKCLSADAVQQALVLAEEAVSECNQSSAAYAVLAAAHLRQAEQIVSNDGVTRAVPYERAIQHASESIKLDGRNPAPLLTRLEARCKVGKFDDAAKDAARMEKLLPGDKLGPLSRVLLLVESGYKGDAENLKKDIALAKLKEQYPDLVAELQKRIDKTLAKGN